MNLNVAGGPDLAAAASLDRGSAESQTGSMKCPYCGNNARKTFGKELWPHRKSLWKKKLFVCKPCDARVGCHDTKGFKWKPFGVMANAALRGLRMRAHAAFDPIWRIGGKSRSDAYQWLADGMGMDKKETHIGMFNEEQCRKVIELCRSTKAPSRGLNENKS